MVQKNFFYNLITINNNKNNNIFNNNFRQKDVRYVRNY